MWMQQAAASTFGAAAAFEAMRVLLALGGVCALALGVLRWLAHRGVGRAGAAGAGRVQVVERVGLGAERALYLVRADGRLLLLGTGPGAAPTLIAELSAGEASLPARPPVGEARETGRG